MEDWIKNFAPQTQAELLAQDVAEALNDRENLALYLSCVKKYPEALIRRVLGQVQDIPDAKIKKSRGALFNYLIQKYGGQNSAKNPGH
jgi:hypothetical protein